PIDASPMNLAQQTQQCTLRIGPPPRSTLFPYTTLFRSGADHLATEGLADALVTQADAEDRQLAGKVLECRHRHARFAGGAGAGRDRKSTRLNSSHVKISYADFS